MPLSDPRFLALNSWIARTLGDEAQLALISGDASFRRYYRVQYLSQTFITMDSPPDLVPVAPFIDLANAYHDHGILAPEVKAAELTQGFLLLSDLGDTQLLEVLTPENVEQYYGKALGLLEALQTITSSAGQPLPDYDDAFVLRELTIFIEWLVEHHLQLTLDSQTRQMIDGCFSLLIENVAQQPKVGMHRDYHSRNLMLCDDELAVIDFQDAVIGPITYDAVSLLRDCYVRWPNHVVEPLLNRHYQQMRALGRISGEVAFSQYRRWFDLMGMQRHLKAAGIFCRLNYRDAKPGYLKDIPLTLSYVCDIGAQYPEFAPFIAWLRREVMPHMTSDKLSQLTGHVEVQG
ncbi:aminoglycoside phosphotransferase family protein [Shewanella sp. cp20]|uniref:aminoglycoside phosphotransferase family protein n=1 Tax=Shewanella sp. cp20 TaxID=1521167 RepID=UPI0005ADBDC9|nr:phosphotransferase [Shewanella sp. cp20]KIO36375.1 aminoglycoside phosphotransferase [Shewanella sp. cp20]